LICQKEKTQDLTPEQIEKAGELVLKEMMMTSTKIEGKREQEEGKNGDRKIKHC
jgi:phosphoenolpyruvate carboxylase